MRDLNIAFVMLFLGALCLAGCSNTPAVSPDQIDGDATAATFNVRIGSSLPNRVSIRSVSIEGSGITITSARLNIEKAELELPSGLSCANAGFVAQDGVTCKEELEEEEGSQEIEAEIEIHGPIVFDLLTGDSTPALSDLTIPSGVYREIEIDLQEADLEDGVVGPSDSLANNTLIAEGTFTDSGQVQHNFRLALKFSEEVEIENETGITVPEGSATALSAYLDVASWFAGLNIVQCVNDGDLTIDVETDTLIIDENTSGSGNCSDIENTIKNNIRGGFDFDDEDHDSIDDDEDDEESGS